MSRSEQKVVQYLNEAHASEMALVRVLQSQIAMTPRGTYRIGLETHLRETRNHAERVQTRLGELGQGGNPLQFLGGVAETVAGQALALAKTPLDLLRGSGGEEKVLKNAKDACATEALEIATYTAIERLARSVGDEQTAKLAASIRADEEKMLERILREIPKLTGAVVGADIEGDPSYDITKTGAADAARATGKAAAKTARKTGAKAKRSTRQARKVPGVAQAEGQVKGAVASQSDLAIAGYDKLTAEEIVAKLSELSQIDLAKVDSYERRHENRTTVLDRVSSLRGDEPWPGYDELTAAEVQTAISEADDDRVKASAPTSAPTRPAPACSRPPSASSPAPEPPTSNGTAREAIGLPSPRVSMRGMTDQLSSSAPPEQGLLAKISTEVVRTLKDSFGKGPLKAKSYMLDDFLIVVMRGGVTVAEQTMLDRGHGDLVRDFRQTYQNEMGDELVAKIEVLTGRKVVNYQSQILFEPHIVMEVFFFADDADEAPPIDAAPPA